MSTFSVNIRGVTVTCNTVGELDVLIERYGSPTTYIHGASAVLFAGAGSIADVDSSKLYWDEQPNKKAIAPQPLRHVSAACEIREALGVVKPHEAEWTWEYALDQVIGLQVNRNMWQQRAADLNAQRERCDRIIEELRSKPPSGNCPKCKGVQGSGCRFCEGTGLQPPPGKLAEKIVYALIKDIVEVRPKLAAYWNDYPQMTKAEITTMWIEKAEAILKGESK